ncbi:shikimate kinase [Patescibacteria group bacterium]
MNIALTGLRGSGKSSIGKILSKKSGWDFIDIDEEVEKAEGKKIKDIIEEKGWDHFRHREKEITQKLADNDNKIIATGGGTIIDSENAKALKRNSKIIYLYRKPEDCIRHILDDPNRPPLTNKESLTEEMNQLYVERNGHYCQNSFKIYQRSEDLVADAETIFKDLF